MKKKSLDLNFGVRLEGLRRGLPRRGDRHVYQREVVKEAGISESSLQQAEKGKVPGDAVLYKLAMYYKVSVKYLKTGQDVEDSDTDTAQKSSTEYNLGQRKVFQVRSPDPEQEYGPRRAYKVSEALVMASRVLESGTSYADALYLNIRHFDRAIQAEERLSIIEDENKQQLDRIMSLEAECEKLKERLEDLESKIPAPSGALKESAEM